ncbi:MAG TPA: T9SS type A sorting domain-containing protein, partial [Flavobacteriales bacterium]|nr:T9SS type A sorting domain-containing protein [Flavobacteriales bacterium]
INVINPLTTGMPEKPELDQLATWPNPVTDELNIQLTSSLRGSVNLDILDLSGRTVLAGNRMLSNGSNRLSLPTGDLNPGMYLLRIGNGSEAQVLRFVKTR